MTGALLERYAKLIVEVGANVQRGQTVLIICAPSAAPLVHAVAHEAYLRGALFVEPWYFDPLVKRARIEHAVPDTLEYVPPWYGARLLEVSERHGARISFAPLTPPGLLDDLDPALAGRDQLPSLRESFDVINARTTNWCVAPWPTVEWARVVHPELDDDAALAKLTEELVYVLRLDEPDAAAAWRERVGRLHEVATQLDDLRLDALRFRGPGTDLTVGLLPTSRFGGDAPGSTTVDGVQHHANLPTEEVYTTPDPDRTEGVVAATKPLELGGTVVRGLRIRFQRGRAVAIDADEGADALRARCAKDEGASRLGEVALVDREGRVGKTATTFFTTLLDENAASHLALGNAYAVAVGDEDLPRINTSAIHIDFMIGGDEVAVDGVTRDGRTVAVMREGAWQFGAPAPG
ncbi:MAG TPA: aminopeptidase [Gaiellaceae bacterium]|nr:aminopeptidase [Gaiellaceae bacterium]